MCLPLWEDANFAQKVLSCALVLLPGTWEQTCAASPLRRLVNHLNWSKQGRGFPVPVARSDHYYSLRGESGDKMHRGETSKESSPFAFDKSCPSLEQKSLFFGYQWSQDPWS